ncbi:MULTISPECIES: PDR/VanB family oxidoreductase [unclassified Beijerinckia]|uniref:PDR/VanB family oxidoreductase n=1 Tax=unclassified Beijerinckia TaxID=2638183 RepID=UPI00089B221B|nr:MULTISPECIES: PDR/VanB family oxidoreductase [unclassified Beijerinckia]MDH7797857.1 ferredoxin-NADP reductase [Beijerinckia sp. GAS462]SED00850.1 Ferredoxin-NADP reductase [Beijerinckia sp. 28-YEA-48]
MTEQSAPFDVRLTAIRFAALDTNLYEFRRLDGAPMPPIAPGAHIDIHLPNGMMRQYSLTTAEGDPNAYVVGIKKDRASRGGSKFIHDQLKVGTVLQLGGPRNNFPLNETAPHTVLVAGGIGITPIWCMAQRLQKLGASWEMHYSCRERPEVAFIDELTKLPNVKLHIDAESNGKFLDIPGIVAAAPAGSHFYCCGPVPMLNAYEAATKDLPEGQMHIEYFTAKEAAALDGGYKVRLERSGQEFTVPPGKTLLHVLRDAGIDVSYSCEEGVCGSCETVVISGTPDHRDNILTESERKASKTMMICCSGSKSDLLVLDL